MNNYEFLDKLVKRASKGKLILLMIILAIMAGMIVLNLKDFKEAQEGPTQLDPYNFHSKDIDEDAFYQIELNDDYYLFETAMFEGDEIDTYYMATWLLDGILVVEVSGTFDASLPYQMKGHFSPIDAEVESALLDELYELDPNGQYNFVSYTFKEDYLDTEGFFIVFAVIAVIFLLILVSYIKSLKFKSSKLYKAMKKIGDPDTIADEIEREYEMSKHVSEGPLHLFTNYIISGTHGAAFILPRENVIWCYPKVTKVKRYFITVSTRHEFIMGTRDGKTKVTSSNEEEVKRLINMMQNHHPSCIYGYSDEIQALFKKNLDEFIKIADSRRDGLFDEDTV